MRITASPWLKCQKSGLMPSSHFYSFVPLSNPAHVLSHHSRSISLSHITITMTVSPDWTTKHAVNHREVAASFTTTETRHLITTSKKAIHSLSLFSLTHSLTHSTVPKSQTTSKPSKTPPNCPSKTPPQFNTPTKHQSESSGRFSNLIFTSLSYKQTPSTYPRGVHLPKYQGTQQPTAQEKKFPMLFFLLVSVFFSLWSMLPLITFFSRTRISRL